MRRGFTLLEVLTALAIAMGLAGMCTTALLHVRSMVKRSEARIALHQRAEVIHLHLHQQLAAVQQSGVFAVEASAGPRLRLLALCSRLDTWDWQWPREGGNESKVVDRDGSDLRWWLLEWDGRPGVGTLAMAVSRRSRVFTAQGPLRNPAAAGIDYGGRRFLNLPQPRRSLGAVADWAALTQALDGNQLFPDPAAVPAYPESPRRSLASADDLGDWGDLLRERSVVATGVADLRLEVVRADGTVRRFAADAPGFTAMEGAWVDGGIAATPGVHAGTAAQAMAGPLGGRPRLLRLRCTLEERLRPRGAGSDPADAVSQAFSFSFAMPGLAGPPSSP